MTVKQFLKHANKNRGNSMNYARNINKISIGKRVVFSWFVIAAIFLIIGFVIGLLV